MCGIVGYIGGKRAAPVLLECLKKLEYRGYDSAGIAVMNGQSEIEIVKAKGKLTNLVKKTDGGESVDGGCGIGHTRWATHGEPNENNAHPHCNDDKSIAAVHNGIIENYSELKAKLLGKGYTFYSETDTEVATKLVDYYYKKYREPLRAISEFALRVRGSYALAVMFSDYPEEIYAIRKDSPMIIGVKGDESFLASDAPAILKYTRSVYYIGNFVIARLKRGKVSFFNLDREKVKVEKTEITWDAESAEKGGYEHFMLKEITEQPAVVKSTVSYGIKDGEITLDECSLSDDALRSADAITIVGCGSAYHVGMLAQYVIERLARVPVRAELASEFRYRDPLLTKCGLFIAVSQSGETADTLAALRLAKSLNVKTVGIVNVLGSSIAREADGVFFTKAGPEISVATTKAYSAQLIAVYLIAARIAYVKGAIDKGEYDYLTEELKVLPEKIEKLIENKDAVQKFAADNMDKHDVFFIGRGTDYAICAEASLKLKEISYIHSEAYAAGELKHGTISLVEKGTLVIAVITHADVAEKTMSNLAETKSRGAHTAVFVSEGIDIGDGADEIFRIPKTAECFAASVAVIPMQLFAYYLSVLRGNDVDKPRNLAKSVTVE